MWILFLWMVQPYSIALSDASQPTLSIISQEFESEEKCKKAFASIKDLNEGRLTLRGICTQK